jgi:heme/copper-type cytochrome/quinol oxidase subunit 2
MFTAKALKILAAVTLVEFAVSAAIGEDHDVLWILDDILWFALILSVLALIVLTVGVLVKSRRRSHGASA